MCAILLLVSLAASPLRFKNALAIATSTNVFASGGMVDSIAESSE